MNDTAKLVYNSTITAKTINKIISPSNNPKFNPWKYNYLDNLNAAVKLPELFENAVYIDTKGNQKTKNSKKQINGFHHFVAPIRMDGKEYRVKITAREKANSDTLYIVDTELLPMKKGAAVPNNLNGNLSATPSVISIPDLVNGVNIYDYDTQKNVTYSEADLKYSLSDSQGRDLTKEQQEYFKDSKVRLNDTAKLVYNSTNSKHMFAVGVDGINNTLIISDGNFNNPTIEKVYHIYADNETDIENLRRYIYEETRANTLSSEIIELYFGNELVTEHQKGDFENYRELRREYEREQSEGTLGENSGVQNRKRSNSETTTKYSIGEKAPNEGVFLLNDTAKLVYNSTIPKKPDDSYRTVL